MALANYSVSMIAFFCCQHLALLSRLVTSVTRLFGMLNSAGGRASACVQFVIVFAKLRSEIKVLLMPLLVVSKRAESIK